LVGLDMDDERASALAKEENVTSTGSPRNDALHRRLKREVGYTCSECGVSRDFGIPIEVHHLDGDPSNNDIDNLIVVCKKCHNEMEGMINWKWGGLLDYHVFINASLFPSHFEHWKIIWGRFSEHYYDGWDWLCLPFRCGILISYPDKETRFRLGERMRREG